MMLLLGILCTFLTISQMLKADSQAEEIFTCETDYWLTVDCFLISTAIPKTAEKHWLQFQLENLSQNIYNCSLIRGKNGYNCSFKAYNIQYYTTFSNSISFKITLYYVENGTKKDSVLSRKYFPSKHIKPITPNNLMIYRANGSYVLKWTSGYENHKYVRALPLKYTLSYHKEGHPSSELFLHEDKTNATIPEASLELDTQYIAKVRSKMPNENDYNGTTSHWSTAITWKTNHTGNPEQTSKTLQPTTAMMIVPICMAVAITFLLLYPVAKTKIKEITWVATPLPFFQSLYQNHQGNFKAWVSKGQVQQTYSEEISAIDIIAEIAAVEQDQAKVSSMCFSPQYHTPYVSPTAEIWVPFQISDKHSIASLSCKDLNFQLEEPADEEPMLCFNTFEPIAVEGFPCMEDLELSQDDLEPSETLTMISKPTCFTQNYCTLTNTPIGLIPTLITGPCEPEPVSDRNVLKDALNIQTEENTTELSLDNLQLSMEE